MRKKLRLKTFKTLRFKVTAYSILAEDLMDGISAMIEQELPTMAKGKRVALADALFQEITLILTEDIDFEGSE